MDEQTLDLIHRRVFSPGFARAVFSGGEAGSIPWVRVVIRPVSLRGEEHWQFSYFDVKKDITKNNLRLEAEQKLDELLALPFGNITVEVGERRLEVRISKKGKALQHESRIEAAPPNLAHDRVKLKLLTPENALPLLQAVEIATADGKVRAEMQAKLRQINEFVRLVDETGVFDRWAQGQPGAVDQPEAGDQPGAVDQPGEVEQTRGVEQPGAAEQPGALVRAVDLGCGKGYLTFALYHYLTEIRGLPAHVSGVDLKSDLLNKLDLRRQELGWEGLHFIPGTIQDYDPAEPPQVVVALHACDTATDDALAKGLGWGSQLIVTAPCCQHYLQAQLARLETPEPFAALMRHGILFERMGDLITDALRAAYLRVWGYRTEVIQFTPLEHTAKNLMIRAVKSGRPGDRRALKEYEGLKAYWGVTPYLETLYGLDLDRQK